MPEIYCTDLPNIMHETIDDEVVVVNLDNGTYYSLVGVGGQIWDLLGGQGRSLASLISGLSRLYIDGDGQIADAAAGFIEQLRAEALIRVAAGEEGGENGGDEGADADVPSQPFVVPTLQKYTDMEALLLADPIHEVDDAGWPNLT